MAATDVMPSTPMSPGLVTPWGGFEDYLDFPSPAGTPRLAPATSFTMTGSSNMSSSSSSLRPPPSSSVASSSTLTPDTNMAAPPPVHGSSPETLFRYYLAAELRRIGSPADDAIIERYVAQHYDSFTRAMERHQTTQAAAADANKDTTMEGIQAFRSPPPSGPSSAPHLLNTASPQALQIKQASATIDPHIVETKASTASPATKPMTIKSEEMDIIVTHPTPSSTSPSAASTTYRSKSADDDMSEDDEEDDEDGDAKQGQGARLRTIEETPIEGSIMGPSNELRPDPDTYRKLTSKEKRQLRNKISARNFRTRRKEHISLLEQQVADRDTLIEGLRRQLAQVSTQNKDLQEEVRALKAKAISTTDVTRIIDALQKSANGSGAAGSSNDAVGQATSLLSSSASSASLSESTNAVRPPTPSTGVCSSPRSMSPRPSISISKPNTRKDLPNTSGGASAARSFWGGVGGSSGNNFMSVHTVLIPSYNEAQLATDKKVPAGIKPMQAVDESLLPSLTEKLSLKTPNKEIEQGVSTTSPAASTSRKQDCDVNAALVSLIDGDDCPPPSYSEAVTQSRPNASPAAASSSPAVPLLDDERVQETILAALNKAFSSGIAGTSALADQKGASSAAATSLDARRIRAIMDGRAHLVLVDADGQPWHDEESESEQQTSSALQSSPIISSA